MPFDFHISGLWLLPRNITDLDSNKMDTMQASISKISDMISNLQHKNIETVTDLGSAVKKNDTLTNSDRDSDDDQEQTRSWMKKLVLHLPSKARIQ